MAINLLNECTAAKKAGADFPTIWQTILKPHPLVMGPPVQRLEGSEAVLEVSLINGQRIVLDQRGYRLA
jgi:hypothetical protein